MTIRYKVQKKSGKTWKGGWLADFASLNDAVRYAIAKHDDEPTSKVRIIRGKNVVKLFNPQTQ